MKIQIYQNLRQRMLTALAHRLPTCAEATHLTSKSMEGKITLWERASMRLHMWSCNLCRRYEQQLKFLRTAAGNLGRHSQEQGMNHAPGLSAEARARMKRSLHSATTQE